MMRRWIVIAATLLCAGILYLVVSIVLDMREEKRRESIFQKTLSSYQEALKPGMTRAQVEAYLQSKGVQFLKSCCINGENRAADLTKIGEGNKLWYCNENTVYIAFQFTTPAFSTAPPPESSFTSADPKEVLDKVTRYQWLGGCL
jgi:hypothetical protein